MSKTQRKRTLTLARRLEALADGADELDSKSIYLHVGLAVHMAVCLNAGFVDPNDRTLQLLEDALRTVHREGLIPKGAVA